MIINILKEWIYFMHSCLNQLDDYEYTEKKKMYFTCPSLNQLDHYEYIKRMDFIKGSCLNQIDHYEYIKTMDVFHTPHA